MISGVIPAMVTPMKLNQDIHYDLVPDLIDYFINSDVDGLFILGTNGEFHLLNFEEKVRFTKEVVDTVQGRIPIIAGVGGNSTKEVIELSKEMEGIGVDVLSVITPFFVIPNSSEMIEHYQLIAQSTNLPVMLYNIPSKTGVNLDSEVVKVLAKEPNIVGIKDSSGDIENIKRYISLSKDEDFNVICGTDSLILEALQEGATGAVAATANVVPKIVKSIHVYWKDDKIVDAEKQQKKLSELRKSFKHGTLPSVLKKLVELNGIPVGPPRLPVKEVSEEIKDKLKEVMIMYRQ